MKKFYKISFLTLLLIGLFALSFDFVLAVSLQNPLGQGNTDPRVIVGNIIRAILGIVGSLALLMFIYGGFTWVTSAGNENKIAMGKNIIIWASFGLAIIFASYALVSFIIGSLVGETNVGGSSTGQNIGGSATQGP